MRRHDELLRKRQDRRQRDRRRSAVPSNNLRSLHASKTAISDRRRTMRQKVASKRKSVSSTSLSSVRTSKSTSSTTCIPRAAKKPSALEDWSGMRNFDWSQILGSKDPATSTPQTSSDEERDTRTPSPPAAAAAVAQVFYNQTPVLDEQQQVLAEYSLPIVLPALFGYQNYTPFALTWVIVLVVGHTLETVLTDFGMYNVVAVLTPLQHHLCDCGWLHTLIHAMLWMPGKFGPGAYWMGICLIQTLPIYLAVSFKSLFVKQQSKSAECGWMGRHLINCFLGYGTATLVLVLSQIQVSGRRKDISLLVGLLLLHATPGILATSFQKKLPQVS